MICFSTQLLHDPGFLCLVFPQIRYWRQHEREAAADRVRTAGLEPTARVSGLRPSTRYYIAVFAYNSAGTGPSSPRTTVTTRKPRMALAYMHFREIKGTVDNITLEEHSICAFIVWRVLSLPGPAHPWLYYETSAQHGERQQVSFRIVLVSNQQALTGVFSSNVWPTGWKSHSVLCQS